MAIENENANARMDAPRLGALYVCFRAIYLVFTTGGLTLGLTSAILTAICVTPLFNSSTGVAGQVSQEVMPEQDQSSHIFTEAQEHDLIMMREEEHTVFGRIIHQGIEIWSENIELFVHAVQVLRENQGLIILLVGGVFPMAMALVAGFDDVNAPKALIVSVTCYGVTTLLVARSTRRIITQRMLQKGVSRLSSAEVTKIIDAIPEEKFVPDDELESCDLLCIESMIRCRQKIHSQKAKVDIDVSGCTLQDEVVKKKIMIADLRQRRNYNESCCICLSKFGCGERIRVLPNCHHEFHRRCIDEWAGTFAANITQPNYNTKSGRPTCPLCKVCFGEAQVCLPATNSDSVG